MRDREGDCCGEPAKGESGSYGGGGGEDGDGVGDGGDDSLRTMLGSRPRAFKTLWGFARTHASNKSTGQSVCVEESINRAGGFQQIASGGWDELLASTPLPRPPAGVGRFGLLWGRQASICNAWMALRTC